MIVSTLHIIGSVTGMLLKSTLTDHVWELEEQQVDSRDEDAFDDKIRNYSGKF